ncbi:MAG: hypothetical protein ACK506_23705 [Pirellula sp.]|jgi:hypothetical protein
METPIIFESKQSLYLDFDEPVTSAMVIDHIKGLEIMARNATYFLEGLLKIELPPPEILITSLKLNSIEDGWIYRLCFGRGEDGAKKFEEFRKNMRIANLSSNQIVGFSLAGAIAYAAWQFAPTKQETSVVPPPPNVLVLIGNEFDKSEDEIKRILESKIASKESIKQGLVKLTRPGGIATTGDIVVNGESIVPAQYLEHVPTTYEKTDVERPFRDVDDTSITFRAVDLDKTTGWWACLDDIQPGKRIAVQLSETIDPNTILTGKPIKADVTVTYRSKEDKTPVRVQVRKLRLDP